MSEDNVEAFKRTVDASNRRDLEAFLEQVDEEVEWHPAMTALLRGETTVYRGREGVREWWRDLEEAFPYQQAVFPEVRDLGDRIVAMGYLRTRGRESGVETETPAAYVVDYRNGKAILVRTFLDHQEALKAAGLPE
jgi:ketosteroid isomerase-like protein